MRERKAGRCSRGRRGRRGVLVRVPRPSHGVGGSRPGRSVELDVGKGKGKEKVVALTGLSS